MKETQLKKFSIVMEGGGMRGLYTAGVIDVLMENEIYADSAVGVSAGAVLDAIISPGRSEEFFAITKSTARIKDLQASGTGSPQEMYTAGNSDIMNCPGNWIFLTVRPTQKIP